MSGIEFGTAPDYHELNAGAHRKPPKVLSAPSLVWHLAFWSNCQELDADGKPLRQRDGSPQKKTATEIQDALDRYIIALHHALVANVQIGGEAKTGQADAGPGAAADLDDRAAAVQLTPCISGRYLLFGSPYNAESFVPVPKESLQPRQRDVFESTNRTATLQFVWKKLDVTIRFEVHTEYFSISTFVELDKERMKAQAKTGFSSIPELNASIDNILAYLRGPDPSAKPATPRLSSADVSVAEESNDPQPSPRPDDISQSAATPSPASDSEQLVVGINKYCFHDFWKLYQQEVLSDGSLADCVGEMIFRQVFADFRGFIASDQAVKFPVDEFFEDGKAPIWGWDAKKKFLPLIQHRNRAEHTRYECAVNYMLDGRALYMSTLGPQLPSMPADERIPVEFIVYVHQRFKSTTIVNKWQLGRLVSQILLLGTLRLCGLKDVKWLHEAGQQLGSLEESTQKAREAIALTEAYSDGQEGGRLVQGQQANAQNREAIRQIADAHKKLNAITGTFLDKTGDGPLYRIERSRYYVQQFEENVKLLRIGRLEGDQPYDQFIRRRLGSEFDFINRLGVRFERATSSIVTLDQNYLAITQNLLVGRATTIDEETNSIQADIQTIQEWGEFALLAALVPYYVMHLLDLIIKEKYVPVLTASVWTVFGGVALYRKFKRWKYVFCFLALAVPVVALVAASLVFDPILAGGILRAYEMPEKQLQTQEDSLGIQKHLEKLADEQLVILRELAASVRKSDGPKLNQPGPDEQKPDQPAPSPAEPAPKP